MNDDDEWEIEIDWDDEDDSRFLDEALHALENMDGLWADFIIEGDIDSPSG